MNRRRALTFTCCAAVLPRVRTAAAQKAPALIAWISPGSQAALGHYEDHFRSGMREHGLREGEHYALEVTYAEGHYERFPALISAALARKPALFIVVTIASVRAAQQATSTVPIVFISTNDPVGSGLVASLARPGGNTTGMSNQAEDLVDKYVELVRDALPKAQRVAMLLNPRNPSNPRFAEQTRKVAATVGLTLRLYEVDTPEALDPALAAMARNRPDVLLVGSDAMIFDGRARISAFALKHRLPSIGQSPEYAESGVLFGLGTSRPAMYRRAARYVSRILAGTKPADLPVEQPTIFELVVNLKTARALGLAIPYIVTLRADRLIE